MAKPSPLNPLHYIIERQYKDVCIKNKIFKERLAKAKNLYRKDLLAHYGCVNAIEFSAEGDLLVSGGDDRRVLLWSVPEAMFGRGAPVAMETNHISNIFCLAFDSGNTKIFSGGNDDQVIIHDAITGHLVGKLAHRKPVYGLSINPQNDYAVATAGDDGRILLFDVREPLSSDPLCVAKQKTGFHSVMFNPVNPKWLATANSEEGIALWDLRKPKEILLHYDASAGPISGISACFNSDGSKVLALRRRLPPVLYATQKESAICQFYHPQYYNSCTMKTCCFAGDDDEYVLSGSDDFNLYMWKMPPDGSVEWGKSHLVLRGHRSIVNQVRYNKENNLIASSGVEKMVKLWSSLPIGTWKGSLQKEHADSFRSVYTHEDYIYLVGHSGERISHDYSDHSTQEDSKMLAFFDSLIQREIEGWESPSENSDFSDSDGESRGRQNVSSILSEMFCNGKIFQDENKKHKSNRIAQLIAKKRSRLARMAHDKATSQVLRYHMKEKNRNKKKTSSKNKTSTKFKKNNGSTKKSTKHFEKESHKHKFVPERTTKLRKYRTRQSLREACDSSPTSSSFDAPSTSTGITSSSNSVFRVIEQDSDEEIIPNNNCTETLNSEENNFVNILPTPLNGSHDMYINVLEMNPRSVVRNEEFVQASTSTEECCSVRRSRVEEDSSDVSDSDFEFDYHTPVKKRRISVSDSGCGTGPCSSTSPYQLARNHQECSSNDFYERDSDDEFNYEKFKKRVSKARLNIRKQIGVDSDSN